MDSRDPHRALQDGPACTVCTRTVPVERVRLLARRPDVTFVQLDCPACGSTTLGFVAAASAAGRPAPTDAISSADVDAVRELLAGVAGDAAGLLAAFAGGRVGGPGDGSAGTRGTGPR